MVGETNALGFSQKELESVAGEKEVWGARVRGREGEGGRGQQEEGE